MLLGVIFSQLGLILLTSYLGVWVFLVLSSLCTLGWLKSFLPSSSLALYFVVSVLGSLIFLLSQGFSYTRHILMCLGLFLIMGFAPFQFWVLPILAHLTRATLITFLGPAKLGYLFLAIGHSSCSAVLPIFSFLLGFVYLFSTSYLSIILYGSSALQLLPLVLLGLDKFWSFQLVYLVSLATFYFYFLCLTTPIFCFLCLFGIPPLGIFSAKLAALSVLPTIRGSVFLVVTALLAFPYLRTAMVLPSYGTTTFLLALSQVVLPFVLSF